MMKKLKVYLAKSNLCDPDEITKVRSLLTQDHIQLFEYRGGEYNNKDLVTADYLVVLPYMGEIDYSGFKCYVGRGVYQQICDFNCLEKTVLITEIDPPGTIHDILYNNILSVKTFNTDCYKKQYGVLDMGYDMNLSDHFIFQNKNQKSLIDTVNEIKISNRYLLLCKPAIV